MVRLGVGGRFWLTSEFGVEAAPHGKCSHTAARTRTEPEQEQELELEQEQDWRIPSGVLRLQWGHELHNTPVGS